MIPSAGGNCKCGSAGLRSLPKSGCPTFSAAKQAELEARKAQGEVGKKSLLNNNDPNFVNPKEKLYDKFPLSVHQMDIIIGVLFALIVLFLVLGMTHTSFFGLFGG